MTGPGSGPRHSASTYLSVYRALVRLYPEDFRRRYGREMAAVLSTRLVDTANAAGYLRAWRLGMKESWDLLRSAADLRLRSLVQRWKVGREAEDPHPVGGGGPPYKPGPYDWLSGVIHDLRYALRTLVKRPGFAAVAVLSLAIGIGATSAVFSVINGTLLRPLPFDDPDRILVLSEQDTRGKTDYASALNYLDWNEQSSSFSHLAAWTDWSHTMTGGAEPMKVMGLRTSASLFDVLGVYPMLGRAFTEEEQQPGRDKVVILLHGFWQSRFGGDPEVLGKTILFDDEEHVVVGVMPAGFMFPDDPTLAFYRPLALYPWEATVRAIRMFDVVGRLAPGITLDQARLEFTTISARMGEQYPETNDGWTVSIIPAREALIGAHTLLVILLGAVGFVLLIACSNIASLLLARARDRQREMAIRTALGATRSQIVRQLLAESLVLASLGGVLGLGLAVLGSQLLVGLDPGGLPKWHEITIDGAVLGFTAVLTICTVMIFGILPAMHVSNPDLTVALRDGGGKATAGGGALRARRLLVVVEVALVMVLLAGAGLLTTSFLKLIEVDPGFNADNLLVGRLDLSSVRWDDDSQKVLFFRDLIDRVEALPGVKGVGMVTTLPMNPVGTDYDLALGVEGRPVPMNERPQVDFRLVSPDDFETMGIPLLEGRPLDDRDGDERPAVVLVNRALAEQFFPNESPVGHYVSLGSRDEDEPYFEVVGVVDDVHHRGLDTGERSEVFMPWTVWTHDAMTIVIRTDGAPLPYAAALKRELHALDPLQPLSDVTSMRQLIRDSVATRRTNMVLLLGLAGFGLVISGIGIYGVISYDVSQRSREFAVRMAMGARGGDVVRMVVRQALSLTAVGIAIGLVAALSLTGVIENMLFGVSSRDPVTIAGVVVLLAGIALLASYLPARRATRLDPSVALRQE